jgi:hypothetical protein
MSTKTKKETADFLKTLIESASAMQKKILQSIPEYDSMPLAQEMTTTQGEKVWKNNPAMQEFRGTVRDFAAVVKLLKEMEKSGDEIDTSSFENIRRRFKVIGG